jgi:dTDP-4-amino-4,6-dideoxygalactose transaminase
MTVPFLDLKAQFNSIRSEAMAQIEKVIDQCAFAGGPFVTDFEDKFAVYCGVSHAVGVASGTDALCLALKAFGIGPGDEVITVPSTFIATAEAISHCGAVPVFVDMDSVSYTLDPEKIEAAITPKTKAVIPVHLFGQTADMDAILKVARAHNLIVIEDAAQAHGAEYKGRRAGGLANAGCFSFYPGKNLGAWGEAGCVTTNDPEIARRIKMLRDHGQSEKYKSAYIGHNGRMDGIQGAVLGVKLKYLEAWNEARRNIARHYDEALAGVKELIRPTEMAYARHVYHLYAVRVKNRDQVLSRLAEKGISCGIHYPIPVHRQEAYAFLEYKEQSFPIAEICAEGFLSLPMYAELTEASVAEVVRLLKDEIRP